MKKRKVYDYQFTVPIGLGDALTVRYYGWETPPSFKKARRYIVTLYGSRLLPDGVRLIRKRIRR